MSCGVCTIVTVSPFIHIKTVHFSEPRTPLGYPAGHGLPVRLHIMRHLEVSVECVVDVVDVVEE